MTSRNKRLFVSRTGAWAPRKISAKQLKAATRFQAPIERGREKSGVEISTPETADLFAKRGREP